MSGLGTEFPIVGPGAKPLYRELGIKFSEADEKMKTEDAIMT